MNKSELLTALGVIYDAVGVPVQQPISEGNINAYQVQGYLASGDIMNRRSVYFFVIDEGLPGEAAYWAAHEPEKPTPSSQFVQDVEAFLAAKIADSTIELAIITGIDEANERAVIVAYRVAASVLEKLEAACGGMAWEIFSSD